MENNEQKQGQIEVTERIKEVSSQIDGEGTDYLTNAIKWIRSNINFREYNQETQEHERSIRFRRTAEQVLEDGYVYMQKYCTDVVILFQALCEAKGYGTNFIRVKENGGTGIHSMVEVEVPGDGWYKVDPAGGVGIERGKFKEDEAFGDWTFWKRGRDSWDLGITSYESMSNQRNNYT